MDTIVKLKWDPWQARVNKKETLKKFRQIDNLLITVVDLIYEGFLKTSKQNFLATSHFEGKSINMLQKASTMLPQYG